MKRSPLKRSSGLKARRKPLTAIQKSAKDEECTIRLPGVCNFRTDTTVLCHSNELAHGKGMRLKAPDEHAAYGCFDCHEVVDGRRPRPEGMGEEYVLSVFREAQEQTRRILKRKGLLA